MELQKTQHWIIINSFNLLMFKGLILGGGGVSLK